jgi:hypothetical protein
VTRYEHTQIGHVIIWPLLEIILIASGGLIGSPFHREPPLVVSIILLVCLVLFYRLNLTPYGWLYNVSGFDAVAITLRDGRKFALGTDDPHGLTTAIRTWIS